MNKDIEVVFDNRIIKKHLASYDELKQFCGMLAANISFMYLKRIAKAVIRENFFYFNSDEQKLILQNTIESFELGIAEEYILNNLMHWFYENDFLNTDGFVTFRLREYKKYIELLVEEAVHRYVCMLEKEHIISYFKELLDAHVPYMNTVYVYSENGSYNILNEYRKNIITINDCDELFLNVMISLAPKNIYFYGMCKNSSFFDTFKSVFENRLKTEIS